MNYIITETDCENNPILKKMGIKAGDTVQFIDVPSAKSYNESDPPPPPPGIEVPKKPPPP